MENESILLESIPTLSDHRPILMTTKDKTDLTGALYTFEDGSTMASECRMYTID
jgi:hypothetical protein